jgi:hypothetical protein
METFPGNVDWCPRSESVRGWDVMSTAAQPTTINEAFGSGCSLRSSVVPDEVTPDAL